MTRPCLLVLVALLGCSTGTPSDGDNGVAVPVDAGTDQPADGSGSSSGVAITKLGAVRGTRTAGVYAYKGIPYAQAPTGRWRWRPPRPAKGWSGERDGTRFGEVCVHSKHDGSTVGSEDCLTLNVWTPALSSSLPVMVYLHGGANIEGSGSAPLIDGRYIAEQGSIVVVTLNYRLGAFGFLAHSAFASENTEGASGNYGLLDQLMALRWIQDNIAAFGGDPTRVTLFGQSAGAVNTCILIASPMSKGLFSRALMMSPAGCATVNVELAAKTAAAAVVSTGCSTASDVAACLRAKAADQIAVVPGASVIGDSKACGAKMCRYNPNVDGRVLTAPPLEIIQKGAHQHLPVIVGTTMNEYSTILPLVTDSAIATEAEYEEEVYRLFGAEFGDFLLEHYPASSYPTPRDAMIAIWSDGVTNCPTRHVLRSLAATQQQAVRQYVWAHTYERGQYGEFGAGHGLDLPFVFGTFATLSYSPSPAEAELSARIMGYWARFAAEADPNNTNAVTPWPVYQLQDESFLVIDTSTITATRFRRQQCDVLDKVVTW